MTDPTARQGEDAVAETTDAIITVEGHHDGAEDDVSADVQTVAVGRLDGPAERGGIVAAVDPGQGMIVARLQTHLDPDEIFAPVATQEAQHTMVDAIRPRPDRKAYDFGVSKGLIINPFEIGGGCIGIREGLKIGYELTGLVTSLQAQHAPFDLRRNAEMVIDHSA